MQLESNKKRASFIAALNAIYRMLGLCNGTVHCKDDEPKLCAQKLPEVIGSASKVLLIGLQPRFLEVLSANYQTRAIDLDIGNIGKIKSGVTIEQATNTTNAIDWCDIVIATGSTIVNGTIADLLEIQKPIIFYGVTISAAAKILNLQTFCCYGH